MANLLRDLRFAFRVLRRDRTFSITALLTLTICLGANVAVFSIVNSVVLSPLPFPESESILLMHNSYPGAGARRAESGVTDYYDRLEHLSELFEEQALYDQITATIGEDGAPRRLSGLAVTPSFFRLLRISPEVGRFFTEEEGVPGAEQKVVLSHALWQQQYGGSRSVIGETIRLDGNAYEIIGVTPENFAYLDPDLQIFQALAFSEQDKADDQRHSNRYENIGRLRPGATIEQVQAGLNSLIEINNERFPQFKSILTNAGYNVQVKTLKEDVIGDVRDNLYLLWAGVLCVLLIGAVNVANLSLARSNSRSKEMATRLAIGASAWKIARQLITESLLLGFTGGLAGLALGMGLLRFISLAGLTELPRGSEIAVESTTVLASLAAVVLVSLALGLLPLTHAVRLNLTSAFREDSRTGTAGRGTLLLRHGLVVAQVALAFLLLAGAGLLFASFREVLAIDPGFETKSPITTARISPPELRYATGSDLRNFYQKALQEIEALPAVARAGLTSSIPFGGNTSDSVILAEGYEMQPGESLISPAQNVVSRGYFETMGISLVEGRFFDQTDTPDSLPAIIIDERLARKYWPGQSALGRRLFNPSSVDDLFAITEDTIFFNVVGVVGEVKRGSLLGNGDPIGAYYYAYSQNTQRAMTFAVRSAGDAPVPVDTLRRTVQQIDSELPVYQAFTVNQLVDNSLRTRRTPMVLSLGFAGIALLLAAVGIYGVLAYLVAQRTREIGIRIALGSDSRSVFALVFRQGALVLGLGFLVGVIGFAISSRYISGMIYGVSTFDPLVMGCVAGILTLVAMLACLAPARRATRIDPVRALNN